MSIENFFPYQVAVAAAGLSRQLEKIYRDGNGLSREEWRVLFLLADVQGLTSRELAQRSSLDKVQISRAAQRLEGKGLITGVTCAHDGRLRDYSCTEAGRALFARVFPDVTARADAVLGELHPDDLAALKRGIEALGRATRR